jgi:GNAT superfamily N-acetyltransferase
MRIARADATERNMGMVLGLIAEAAGWLRETKDTDQWQSPWPDEEQRNERVWRGLTGGKTWIVWSREEGEDEEVPAATVTIARHANPAVWPHDVSEAKRAVYVHRLITARTYAGQGLGADLIDWAGQRAAREYGARWIRIDVWRDNLDLHKYYLGRGFDSCGECPDARYPSSALFQKAVPSIEATFRPQFIDTDPWPFA